jgi:hypothetical protein
LNLKLKPIPLAFLGCASIALFLWFAARSKTVDLLHQHVPKSKILEIADEALRQTEFAEYDLSQTVELKIDNLLLRFAQLHLDSKRDFLPIGEWEILWRGAVESKKEGPQDVSLLLRYDFKGRLVRLEQVSPNLSKPINFKESEALNEARNFLVLQDVDTTGLVLRDNTMNQEDRVLRYHFEFSRPAQISPNLQERYDVNISGRSIASYSARVAIDSDTYAFPASQRTSEIVYITAAFVSWALIGIFLISVFFYRLKHDLLEFKRSLWLAMVTFVLMFVYLFPELWPDWKGIALGGGIASLFAGLGILITFSVAESLNREVWQEKISLLDVISKGHFRVRELGESLLYSLFISGVSLLILSALFWAVTRFNLGYLHLDDDVFWIFSSNAAIIPNISKNLVASLYVGLALFSFWLAYLKSKIQSHTVLVVLLGIFINFAGLDLFYLRASYAAIFLFIPIAMLWAFFVLKFDLVTIIISFFTINLFLEISLVSLTPNGLLSAPGVVAISILLLLFVSGSYFSRSRARLKDFAHYVPSYMGRVAERERFLKELEIARNVQQRFLPQSVPSFPNLEIACICRPAMEVGGDYYDFIRGGDRFLGVVIGDVSGKGVSAAFYMTMVKGIIKTLVRSTINPKKILTEMNSIFYDNVPREVFISLICGLFDMEERTLTFARAGHNPIIVHKSTTKESKTLNSKGLAIGLEKGHLFSHVIEEITVPIEPGDAFVFFTDGISESMNKNGEEFGEERLSQVVAKCNNSTTAEKLLGSITAEVSRFSGNTTQHDDFTMVVVRVAG